MRLLPVLASAALTVLAFGAVACPSAAPALADRPNISVGISWDVDPPEDYRLCPIKVTFTGLVGVRDWPAGMAHTVTYHWETAKGKRYPDHDLTIQGIAIAGMTPNPTQSHFLTLHAAHGLRDQILFVVTKPIHHVQKTGHLDILCR